MGRDLVAVKAGNITIEAGGDGVKATNDADPEKGNVALEGGVTLVDSNGNPVRSWRRRDARAAVAGSRVPGPVDDS